MEIEGELKVIGEVQHVSDKFRKLEIVVTTGETYPQHIPIQLTQDKTELIANYKVGDKVRVSINIRGREHQGKYYCNIDGWRMESVQSTPATPTATSNTNDNDEVPF